MSLTLAGNSGGFETLIESMQRLAEDVSDPPSQKVAFMFFNRCVSTWGQPSNNGQAAQESLPGFERFIYERLVPTAFRVPSLPDFNIKDGQMMVVSVSLWYGKTPLTSFIVGTS